MIICWDNNDNNQREYIMYIVSAEVNISIYCYSADIRIHNSNWIIR